MYLCPILPYGLAPLRLVNVEQAARMDLISNKQRLEQDIRVKENSLKIDQQKCMTLRYI